MCGGTPCAVTISHSQPGKSSPVLVARIRECLAHPMAESFKENLERLAAMACGGSRVRIGLDFADLSFGFAVIRPDGSCWIVGGLLFHGARDRGGDGGSRRSPSTCSP